MAKTLPSKACHVKAKLVILPEITVDDWIWRAVCQIYSDISFQLSRQAHEKLITMRHLAAITIKEEYDQWKTMKKES